jgi:hypothetical protein
MLGSAFGLVLVGVEAYVADVGPVGGDEDEDVPGVALVGRVQEQAAVTAARSRRSPLAGALAQCSG